MSRKEKDAIPVYVVQHPKIAFLEKCLGVAAVVAVIVSLIYFYAARWSDQAEAKASATSDAWHEAPWMQRKAFLQLIRAENVRDWIPLINHETIQHLTEFPSLGIRPTALISLEEFSGVESNDAALQALKGLKGMDDVAALDLATELKDASNVDRFIKHTKEAELWFETGFPPSSIGNILSLSNYVLTGDKTPEIHVPSFQHPASDGWMQEVKWRRWWLH